MTPCVWRILCIRSSSSVLYFRQPPNLPTAARRNRKCTECVTTASAETECPPKVPIWPHSAPKPKPKFGRPLATSFEEARWTSVSPMLFVPCSYCWCTYTADVLSVFLVYLLMVHNPHWRSHVWKLVGTVARAWIREVNWNAVKHRRRSSVNFWGDIEFLPEISILYFPTVFDRCW